MIAADGTDTVVTRAFDIALATVARFDARTGDR